MNATVQTMLHIGRGWILKPPHSTLSINPGTYESYNDVSYGENGNDTKIRTMMIIMTKMRRHYYYYYYSNSDKKDDNSSKFMAVINKDITVQQKQ